MIRHLALVLVCSSVAGLGAAFVAIAFYARYRIDKQRHAEVQRQLDERRAGEAAA